MRDHWGLALCVQFTADQRLTGGIPGCQLFSSGRRRYGVRVTGWGARIGRADMAYRPEEFPRFTSFWFERPAKDRNSDDVLARVLTRRHRRRVVLPTSPGGTQIMDIDSALYPRKPIERLGIAPLTSMFFYGENDRRD